MIDCQKYAIKIGLEIHAQLNTKTKLFSNDPVSINIKCNSKITPYTVAYPGTLPVLNKHAVEKAVKAGGAFKCNIQEVSLFERKNYFYPDLPKGYQITQQNRPLCINGSVEFINEHNELATINIQQIHLEEDSGKIINKNGELMVDLQRAGNPLIEIVTKPEIKSPKDAKLVVSEIRKILRYIEVSGANMELGQLRCDANVSVNKKGSGSIHTKVEIKNLNSLRNIEKAIEYEIALQKKEIEKRKIENYTKGYDEKTGKTFVSRLKESSVGYRYLIEPDLPPLVIEEKTIIELLAEKEELPSYYYSKLIKDFSLSIDQIRKLSEEKNNVILLLEVLKKGAEPLTACKIFIQVLIPFIKDIEIGISELETDAIVQVIDSLYNDEIDFFNAKIILADIVKRRVTTKTEVKRQISAFNNSFDSNLNEMIEAIVKRYPEKVIAYQCGKTNLLGFFMGEIICNLEEEINRKTLNEMLKAKLDKWQVE